MNIEKNKVSDYVSFNDLDIGSVFSSTYEDGYYMKTNPVRHSAGGLTDSVCLTSGCHFRFQDENVIHYPKHKLIIE